MQTWVVVLTFALCLSAQPLPPSPQPPVKEPGTTFRGIDPRPVGEAEGIFAYRFEKGDLRYGDLLTLRDGSKRLGKVMEWAD